MPFVGQTITIKFYEESRRRDHRTSILICEDTFVSLLKNNTNPHALSNSSQLGKFNLRSQHRNTL